MESIQKWLELTILLPTSQGIEADKDMCDTLQETIAEEMVAMLGRGVEMLHNACGIRAYLSQEEATTQLPMIHELLKQVMPAEASCEPNIQIRSIENKDWMEEWKKGFKPLRIGNNIVVKPSWIPMTPGLGDLIIEIDPGQAFGTGTHATTQLVLEALEGLCNTIDPSTKTLLDVGTGTGILAIGAAKLGFKQILCIDNDPLAVEAAVENVRRNEVINQVQVSDQDIATISQRFDVILANLDRNTLLSLAKPLVNHLNPNAFLILSGILTTQQSEVESCFTGNDMQTVRILYEHSDTPEWVCLVMQKIS